MSMKELRYRFWIEAVLATTTGLAAMITLVRREWIELLFGVDPDGSSGLLEWAIVATLAAATLLFGLLARAEWRYAQADSAS